MTPHSDSSLPLRRSLHFVPGANEKMLTKSLASPADSLVLDLEDAVTPECKDDARRTVADWLHRVDFGRQERTVRINPLASPWGEADLRMTMVHPPDAYVIPKVQSLADLETLDRLITELETEHGHPPGQVTLILVATETPQGVLNLPSFTQCPRVSALSWGAEDLSAAIGARRNRDEAGEFLDVFKYCRIQTLLCASAGDVQPLDTVFVDIRDTEGLREECRYGAWMGYTGKITIHPDQIPIVHEYFTPSAEEIAQAEALITAFEDAKAQGRMAFRHEGQMVDVPHLTRAQKLLERARLIAASDH